MFHVKHQQKQKAKCFTWNIKQAGRKMLHVKRQQKQKAKCFTWNIKKKEAKCFM